MIDWWWFFVYNNYWKLIKFNFILRLFYMGKLKWTSAYKLDTEKNYWRNGGNGRNGDLRRRHWRSSIAGEKRLIDSLIIVDSSNILEERIGGNDQKCVIISVIQLICDKSIFKRSECELYLRWLPHIGSGWNEQGLAWNIAEN